MNAVSRMKTHF